MEADPDSGRLGATTLAEIQRSTSTPGYDRNELRHSILHIGVGSFHRAHLATYIDDLCRAGNRDWSIVGSGVLASDATMASVLREQDHLYTLIVRGPDSTDVRVIGSIVDYVHGFPDHAALVERVADPTTEIVSLTITEGGYPIDDLTGEYQPESPTAGPTSAFGILAAGLALRLKRAAPPLSVVSCDNIMSNGDAARVATVGEADRIDPGLANAIDGAITFPNSMVDRITPATTDADRAWLFEETGIRDSWPVVTEPFRQWVLEDSFAAGRPPVEDLGVILTSEVEPYELMKLRLLNAGHSCLAYLSALAGMEHVHTAMADPLIHDYVRRFLDREASPVLPTVPGIDLEVYKASLISRFSNPQIADQIARLCLDGSAKFPKFLLPTVRANLEAGGPVELAALGLAGWCAYLNGRADDGTAIDLAADPDLETAVEWADASRAEPSCFLHYGEVFDPRLAEDARFVSAFSDALSSLRTRGVRSTIEATLHELEGRHGGTPG